MIYLDNAATTFIKPVSVTRAVNDAMMTAASPGRGAHRPAMRAAEIVYGCRTAAAELFNVSEPERIVFTMNATHALNIAIGSLVAKGTRVVISGYEHNSVTRPLNALGAEIITAESPLFDEDKAIRAFDENLKGAELAVCTHVSNAFGFVLPIYEIAKLCRKRAVPLIVDASQSAGILEVDQSRLGAAFIAMPGHKGLFGLQGTGILICGEPGRALLSGGSGSDSRKQSMPDYLPDRHEAGTHNVPGIAGLGAGIEYVLKTGTDRISAHEKKLTELAIERLTGIDGLEVFGTDNGTQSGVLSFRHSSIDSETLAAMLNDEGICVRAGLHCAPTAHRTVGTIERGTVRMSFSPFTEEKQLETACRKLGELLRRER